MYAPFFRRIVAKYMFVEGSIPENNLNDVSSAENDRIGAVTAFIGSVRGDVIDGKKVEKIEFSCHKSIAEKAAKDIIEESKKRFGILDAEIWHSIGTVKTGEPCFLVKVLGIHRKECFDALPYIVDEVKSRCPIFGKEVFQDGQYKWKENKL